jgi:hypothetical protein
VNTTYFRKNTFIQEREVSPEITQACLKNTLQLIEQSESVLVIAQKLQNPDLSQQIDTYGKIILVHVYRTLYFAHYLQLNPFIDVLSAFLRQYTNVVNAHIEAVKAFQKFSLYNK